MKKSLLFLIIILLIWNVILTYFTVYNKTTNTTITEENVYGFSTDLTKVADAGNTSVVVVETTSGKQSGFIYKQDDDIAYIVTTYHGIENDTIASVMLVNGKTFPANVVGYDFVSDIAVLSIETPYKLNVVKCGDNEFLKEGEFIINIGTSGTSENINDIELGVVSNSLINIKDEVVFQKDKYTFYKELISLSINSSKGYSGSPLFNMNSEVVGMIEMSNDNGGIFAMPINELKVVVDGIISGSDINKLDLGISGEYIKSLKDYERNIYDLPLDVLNGYYVKNVDLNKFGFVLGLTNGDIILSINGKQIISQKDLLSILYSNNEELVLSVVRNNETIELKNSLYD